MESNLQLNSVHKDNLKRAGTSKGSAPVPISSVKLRSESSQSEEEKQSLSPDLMPTKKRKSKIQRIIQRNEELNPLLKQQQQRSFE